MLTVNNHLIFPRKMILESLPEQESYLTSQYTPFLSRKGEKGSG